MLKFPNLYLIYTINIGRDGGLSQARQIRDNGCCESRSYLIDTARHNFSPIFSLDAEKDGGEIKN